MKRLVLILALLAVLLGGALLWLASAPVDQAAMGSAPMTDAAPDTAAPAGAGGEPADGPDNSFIVCPGNPRCP